MPHTAHPAFDKAGQYFGIKMVHIPVSEPDFRVDPAAVERHINENTIALVGSAGNYPYGLIDPLEKLSDLALKHDIGFHVDGCLGGFILPWIEKLGYTVPTFDFRLPGVTSMSADTHKFGYGLKGTSVVLYRNNALRLVPVFQCSGLARRHICLSHGRRKPLRRVDRGHLGLHDVPGGRRVPEGGQRHHGRGR